MRAARTSCSRPSARTARGSSGRTASASPSRDRGLNATFGPRALPPGNVAVSSQSGALGLALLEAADGRGLGLSAFVSIGNKADVSSNDLLEYWEDDPDTEPRPPLPRVVRQPAKVRAARPPRRAQEADPRHEGWPDALGRAGDDVAHGRARRIGDGGRRALPPGGRDPCRHARGADRRRRACSRRSRCRAVAGSALLTNAGGLGILAADACEAAGLELPSLSEETREALAELLPREASLANPVDMLGSATEETFEAALPHVLRDPAVDCGDRPLRAAGRGRGGGRRRSGRRGRRAGRRAGEARARRLRQPRGDAGGAASRAAPGGGVPVSGVGRPRSRPRGRAGRVAAQPGRPASPSSTAIDDDGSRGASSSGALTGSTRRLARARRRRALLAAYGIPVVAEQLASPCRGGRRSRRALGYPVVVKTAAARRAQDRDGAASRSTSRRRRGARGRSTASAPPVVVQPMVRGGAELLAGVVQDPVFGPLVAFGPGGVLAELIGEAQFRIAPLTDVDADELVQTGKAGRLVAGFRGAPRVRRGRARRPRPPAVAPRRGLARGGRARPQPRHRAQPTAASPWTRGSACDRSSTSTARRPGRRMRR